MTPEELTALSNWKHSYGTKKFIENLIKEKESLLNKAMTLAGGEMPDSPFLIKHLIQAKFIDTIVDKIEKL